MTARNVLWALAAAVLGAAPVAAADPPARRPNVLFCIADDASPHLGAYGYKWVKTPNIDRLAAAGLVFDNAYVPTAKCAPCRAALLTGRYPWQLEEAANHQAFFPAKYKAFTEALRDAGVHAGSAGKVWGPGTATTADGKPRHWGMTPSGGGKKADYLAPTLLELFGVDGERAGLTPIAGISFTDLLRGKPDRERPFVITGRERNDARARPGTEAGLGYPVRAIREGDFLYVHNFAPDRWPCGNPELGLKDTDAGPTKKLIEDRGEKDRYWQLCFGKRPADELFDLAKDPDCVTNLAAEAAYGGRVAAMREKLFGQLRLQNDPRVLGKGDVFDDYPTTAPKK